MEVKVRFYKTIAGRDRLVNTRTFNTMEEAISAVDAWEAQTIDNYAVYGG